MCDKGKQRESMSTQWFAEAMYTKIIGSDNLTYQGKMINSQIYCTRIHSVEQQLRINKYHSILENRFKTLQI